MPLTQFPQYNPITPNLLPITNPGMGGLNLKNLEYEQDLNQSPKMLNMVYRNGVLAKRKGQVEDTAYEDEIYSAIFFDGKKIVHSGDKIYIDDKVILEGVEKKSGLFIPFNKKLYYLCDDYYIYDGDLFYGAEPYVPEIVINRSPDGTTNPGDFSEGRNILGEAFTEVFDSDGTSTQYHLFNTELDSSYIPTVLVNEEEWTYDVDLTAQKTFKIDFETGIVTFKTAPTPNDGINNVVITVGKENYETRMKLLSSKYYACYGGDGNSMLLLGGNGDANIFYSYPANGNYFPDSNYFSIGNSQDDITGFGLQYNVLIAFKPKEMYSISYYIQTSSTTSDEDAWGTGAFKSLLVNSTIGCDAPNSIQLINNQLTWLSSTYGVCTLVSTNIIDERNVRQISRNIDVTSALGIGGLSEWKNSYEISSADYDNKYFIANPETGECFMWDYGLTPYANTGYIENDAKRLGWFKLDNIFAKKFIFEKELYYISNDKKDKLIRFTSRLNDFGEPINAYYQTPMFSFYKSSKNEAVEFLKNVESIYIQVRGDTASRINITYITDENPEGEKESEPITVHSRLFDKFSWNTFGWSLIRFGKTHFRKCSLKKIQMAGVYFYNNDIENDIAISHLSIQYTTVKTVK